MKRLRLDLDGPNSGENRDEELCGDDSHSPQTSPRPPAGDLFAEEEPPTSSNSGYPTPSQSLGRPRSPVQDSFEPTLESPGATQISSRGNEDTDFDNLIEEAMSQRDLGVEDGLQQSQHNVGSDILINVM